jgi:UDP-N-acetylglucosamine 4,6-dehydratase/UDP-glucose 4-epimerase
MKIIKGHRYLVTGGTGFLGEKLVQNILEKEGLVRVISRDEGKLISLKEKFPSIEIHTGDICDKFEVHQACKNINGIFHLAAFKHVGLAEKFSRECTKTNVIGTLNVLDESLENDFEFVIGISTDKAAQVKGVYGASKLLMESLFKQYELINSKTQYRVVRYGNVIYSTGSVLCKWKDLLSEGREVIVTDPEATRFFWTIDEAIKLIFDCLENAQDSSPYVPSMKSMSIKNLLEAMRIKYLPKDKELKVKVIGLQKGENMHEKILEFGPSSDEVETFSIDEILEKI